MRFCQRTILLGFGILLLSVSVRAAVPVHEWSQRFGATGDDIGYAVAVDGSGNVIVTGHFSGTVDFGGGNLTSAGGDDIFVAKYDASGAHQWSQRFGSTGSDIGYAVAVDGSNVIVTGSFQGTVDFGGGNLVTSGLTDIFLVKYDASGAHQWSRRFGDTGVSNVGLGVVVDGSGNVVVTGSLQGAVNFGGGDLVSAGSDDIFVAKYNASGTYQWSQRFGGTNTDAGQAVAVDGSGNVFVTGYFWNTVDFGGGNLSSAGLEDIFVAKYDASGAHQWSKRFGAVNRDYGHAVAVDASGNVIVTGYFRNTVDFGGGNLTSAGNWDIFMAKYDAGGAHQWSQRFGGSFGDIGNAVAVDGSGNVIVTGYFQSIVDFGGGNLTSAGGGEIFVAKYDASGAHQWSQRFGGTSTDIGQGVVVDGSGNVIVTGRFQGTVDFGGGDLTSAGGDDIFVAKYSEEEPVPVLISAFNATPRGGAVDLAWRLWSDEALDRFTLYRRYGASPSIIIAQGDAGATRSYTDTSVEPGETYHYELVIRTAGGDEFRSPVATVTAARLDAALYQNFPNPFNPTTTISFTLSEAGPVTLVVYDVEGRRVRTLVDGPMNAGDVKVTWDGRDAAGTAVGSGMYFYRLEVGKQTLRKRMVLLK